MRSSIDEICTPRAEVRKGILLCLRVSSTAGVRSKLSKVNYVGEIEVS